MNNELRISNKGLKVPYSLFQIRYSSFLFLILSSLFLIPLTMPQAHAQSVRNMTVVPPTIQATVTPGETVEGRMKLINDSTEALSLSVIMQDFVVDNKNSVPNILPPNSLSNKYSAANWIGLDPMGFSIPPGKAQEISYFIKIPSDARPGGHYAATIFSPGGKPESAGSGALVNTQIGTLFYITVKGVTKQGARVVSFQAPGFQEYAPVRLSLEIQNLGDLHIQPNGQIKVVNMFGKTAYSLPMQGKNIFPGASRQFADEIGRNHFMIGRYKATFTALYGLNNNLPLVASVYFWVFPWKIAVVILLILIAVILGIIALRKRRNNPPPAEPQPQEERLNSESGIMNNE